METLVLYGAVVLLGLLAVGLSLALYLSRSDDQHPIEAAELLDAVDDAAVVLDSDGEILLANVAFRSLFTEDPLGTHIEDALAGYPAVSEAITDDDTVVQIDTRSGTRHLQLARFSTDSGRDGGKQILLFHDVTDHCEHQQTLQAQNERLEAFASLISHDLRNPLDVAIGRTNAAIDRLDDPEIAELLLGVRDAHDRMRRIITDVLTLAREGKDIEDVSPVDLDVVATDVWSYVDTGDSTLEATSGLTIEADRERLEHVLQNLFDNAITHGGDSVTVRVGRLDDEPGFYVADDGVGIPESERPQVFETGYTDDDGTGLGLAIVERLTTAHGWELAIADAESGGARFEFTGVECHHS